RSVVACPLVANKEVWTAWKQMRYFERSTQREAKSDSIVRRLWSFKSGERVRPRVQQCVIENEPEAAVVKTLAVEATIAEGLIQRELRSSGIVDAAVDKESV